MHRQNLEESPSLRERWENLSKKTKNTIYGIISLVPTVGFGLLAYFSREDVRVISGIISTASGLATTGFFSRSVYYGCQEEPQVTEKTVLLPKKAVV